MVVSLIQYFENERDNDGPLLLLTAVRDRVAAALKISITTVWIISAKQEHGNDLAGPKKNRERETPILDLNDGLKYSLTRNKPPPVYMAETLAEHYGQVLRLPPYHCIFKPIEMIWEITNTYYRDHVGQHGSSVVTSLDMWKESLRHTPEIWANSVRHTEQIIQSWWERENILDSQDIPQVIINVGEDDSDDRNRSKPIEEVIHITDSNNLRPRRETKPSTFAAALTADLIYGPSSLNPN
ncbi:unnamed protein product [Phaedon cochleariae]|uniref:Uncharacterized protein n=1 Tax=Phaedon cochleariae TaxID=80249 RepID=A0A9N9X533_PHACE|nr:unnamed protein product [Phaedon cochleariae]